MELNNYDSFDVNKMEVDPGLEILVYTESKELYDSINSKLGLEDYSNGKPAFYGMYCWLNDVKPLDNLQRELEDDLTPASLAITYNTIRGLFGYEVHIAVIDSHSYCRDGVVVSKEEKYAPLEYLASAKEQGIRWAVLIGNSKDELLQQASTFGSEALATINNDTEFMLCMKMHDSFELGVWLPFWSKNEDINKEKLYISEIEPWEGMCYDVRVSSDYYPFKLLTPKEADYEQVNYEQESEPVPESIPEVKEEEVSKEDGFYFVVLTTNYSFINEHRKEFNLGFRDAIKSGFEYMWAVHYNSKEEAVRELGDWGSMYKLNSSDTKVFISKDKPYQGMEYSTSFEAKYLPYKLLKLEDY